MFGSVWYHEVLESCCLKSISCVMIKYDKSPRENLHRIQLLCFFVCRGKLPSPMLISPTSRCGCTLCDHVWLTMRTWEPAWAQFFFPSNTTTIGKRSPDWSPDWSWTLKDDVSMKFYLKRYCVGMLAWRVSIIWMFAGFAKLVQEYTLWIVMVAQVSFLFQQAKVAMQQASPIYGHL